MNDPLKIVILNYGVNNLKSVLNAFRHVADSSCEIIVTSKPEELKLGDAFVLPGVGSFREGFAHFQESGLEKALSVEVLEKKKPVWAICLGLQFLMNSSEEGGHSQGLGWIPGRTIRFDIAREFRVPHIGWNDIKVTRDNPFFKGVEAESGFYFDHSFHIEVENPAHVIATCDYGLEFAAAVQRENIVGMQFHPEKSHVNGLQAITNYIDFARQWRSQLETSRGAGAAHA